MKQLSDAKKYWKKNEALIAQNRGYFSQKYGMEILRKTNFVLRNRPALSIDFGCGPGYFLDLLTAYGHACLGTDIVAGSGAQGTFSPRFKVPILNASCSPIQEIQSGSAHRIYLIEVIEHLTDSHLKKVMGEIRRIAHPKRGEIIVTTPNQENLLESTLRCPFCSKQFHRWQHVRSLNQQSLVRLLEKSGWETVSCEEVNWDRPARTLRNFLRQALFLEVKAKTKPHLFYAGRIRARRLAK